MKLYVGNLSYDTNENELSEFFKKCGAVKEVKIITDRDSGKSKGFGFVEMENQTDAEKAINELNEKELNGRALKVNEAKPFVKKNFSREHSRRY